jgi:hypothetical protein
MIEEHLVAGKHQGFQGVLDGPEDTIVVFGDESPLDTWLPGEPQTQPPPPQHQAKKPPGAPANVPAAETSSEPPPDKRNPVRSAAVTGLVFLGHSHGDKEIVRNLYRKLKADNFNCWFDEEDLLGGQDWDFEITSAIRRSKLFLACLSKASITKAGYLQKEIRRALDVADEQPEGVAYIIPVRLEGCEVPTGLSRWQWIDLFTDDGYGRLVRALRAKLDEPQAEPSDSDESNAETSQTYSSNDFNVSVTTAIRQAWWDCFEEKTNIEMSTARDDGGVDGLIWPLDQPEAKISFHTFPSPENELQPHEAVDLLNDSDPPGLIVTRLPVFPWRPDLVVQLYRPRYRFLQWTGVNKDKDALKRHLRALREEVN